MKLPMLVAAATLMMFGAAAAQPAGGNPAMAKVREACSADMAKLCPDKTGADRRQCMQDNKDKLSDGCKSAIGEMMSAMQAQKPQ